jgi:hypothetical protein
MICQSCHKVYIEQTGTNLIKRYEEHVRNIRHNKEESAFAQHVLNEGHLCGPMGQIMDMVEYVTSGSIINIKENYYV